MEAPINLCVTCDPTRGDVVLGRNSMPETDVYSTCCAVENLWLAARSEGIGVGWVSILKQPQLRKILGIPFHKYLWLIFAWATRLSSLSVLCWRRWAGGIAYLWSS